MKMESKGNLFLKISIVTLVMVLLTTMTISAQKASAAILGELADSNDAVSKEYVPDPDSRASMRWKSDGLKSEANTDPNEYWVYEKDKKGELKDRAKVYDMKVNEKELRYIRGGGEGNIFCRYETPKDDRHLVTVAMDVMVTKTNKEGTVESYGLYDAHSSSLAPTDKKKGSADCKFSESGFKEGNYGILTEAIIAKLGLGGSDSSYTYEMYVDRFTITWEGGLSDSVSKEYVCDPDSRASMRWRSDGWKSEPNTDSTEYWVYKQKFDDKGNVKDVEAKACASDLRVDPWESRSSNSKYYFSEARLVVRFSESKEFSDALLGDMYARMDIRITKINKEGIVESYGLYGSGYYDAEDVVVGEDELKEGQEGLLEEALKAKEGQGDSNYTYEVYVDRITVKWE